MTKTCCRTASRSDRSDDSMNPKRLTAFICLATWWASEGVRGAAWAWRSLTRRCILPSRPYSVGVSSTCSRQRRTRLTVTGICLFHIPSRVHWVCVHKSSDDSKLKQERWGAIFCSNIVSRSRMFFILDAGYSRWMGDPAVKVDHTLLRKPFPIITIVFFCMAAWDWHRGKRLYMKKVQTPVSSVYKVCRDERNKSVDHDTSCVFLAFTTSRRSGKVIATSNPPSRNLLCPLITCAVLSVSKVEHGDFGTRQ